MDAVHWFALFGLGTWLLGAWAWAQAFMMKDEAIAQYETNKRQMAMFREAIALARYGAVDEATDILTEIIKDREDADQ